MSEPTIIDWPAWTDSLAGRYVLEWEQTQLDAMVADMFGYHAVQLGMPVLDALRENRMTNRCLAFDSPNALMPISAHGAGVTAPASPATTGATGAPAAGASSSAAPAAARASGASTGVEVGARISNPISNVCCDFLELPFATQSIDLLVMPHTLEFSEEPHQLLREAERVLLPEGRLVITGFNTLSLWGVRDSLGRWRRHPPVPHIPHLIAFARMKDWLKLLGFELSRGRFGCYRPPLSSAHWLERFAFLEAAGNRWWPIFGATYILVALKRERGMRLVGPNRKRRGLKVPALAPAATTVKHGE